MATPSLEASTQEYGKKAPELCDVLQEPLRWLPRFGSPMMLDGALATFGNPFGLALYDREQWRA